MIVPIVFQIFEPIIAKIRAYYSMSNRVRSCSKNSYTVFNEAAETGMLKIFLEVESHWNCHKCVFHENRIKIVRTKQLLYIRRSLFLFDCFYMVFMKNALILWQFQCDSTSRKSLNMPVFSLKSPSCANITQSQDCCCCCCWFTACVVYSNRRLWLCAEGRGGIIGIMKGDGGMLKGDGGMLKAGIAKFKLSAWAAWSFSFICSNWWFMKFTSCLCTLSWSTCISERLTKASLNSCQGKAQIIGWILAIIGWKSGTIFQRFVMHH